MEAGVQFTAADMPEADLTHLQLMMVFAEHEARAISARTKAALAAAKARGATLGVTGREVSAEVRAAKAKVRAQDRLEAIEDVRANGATSLQEIAAALNERGIPTPTQKGEWSAIQVSRILAYA